MQKFLSCSLFLLGLLIVLSATTTSLNVNLLPNVIAQEYRYDDNKYSEYPNKVNKYECQRGLFEGFFVTSPEFCDIQMKEKPESPPVPPQTSSLTVYKEVFGCDNIIEEDAGGLTMNCKDLPNNSPLWINCEDAPMNMEVFCQNLPENLFDIRVSDSQNNPIANDFVGSATGTTFDNLQPGTYTVEEIKHETSINQLGESQGIEDGCKERGFTDGGLLDNQNAGLRYFICFEYEDEQGNDCNTITLVVGEQRTCTVKNYIHDTAIIR